MIIIELTPTPDWTLTVIADNGTTGKFDVNPYLNYEAFEDLKTVFNYVCE